MNLSCNIESGIEFRIKVFVLAALAKNKSSREVFKVFRYESYEPKAKMKRRRKSSRRVSREHYMITLY